MLLGFFTVVIMLACVYAFWRQGVLPAFAMVVNILLSGLVAFNFFELIAEQLDGMLAGSFLHGYEDSFCLVALFCLTLGFLRWASNELIHAILDYHPAVQQGGAVLFGLMAGYLVAGFMLCVAQTLPMGEHFMNFEARIDPQATGAKLRRVMPPDRVWLALMHRASKETFVWGEESVPFDADGSFELRYLERRAGEDKQ